jgi:hypothetical protein
MRTEHLSCYEAECTGVAGADGKWLAYLAVIGPGRNPMHRNYVLPYQQVVVERSFDTEREAEQAALEAAKEMIKC